MKKHNFIRQNWCKEKSTVALVHIKTYDFDYPKRLINRINEVDDFSIKYRNSDV